jgi:hypothetical protein
VHPTVAFDRAMDATTLTSTSVRLRNGISAATVPASLSYDGPSRTLTLTPDDPLEPGTPYELTVDATLSPSLATDTLGNPAPALRNRFTTGPGTLPVVAGLTSAASKSVALSWQMPDFGSFRNVAVYYKAGAVQPASPSDGTLLYYGSLTSFTLAAPALAQDHSFSVFAYTQLNSLTPQSGVTVLGSTTTITTTPAAPVYGTSGGLTVVATVHGSDGSPMGGRAVTLFSRRPGHPWGALGTATTTAAGQVSIHVTPTQSTDFDAVTAGDATHLASTTVLSVPLRFFIEGGLATTSAKVGTVVRLQAVVYPIRVGEQVWLEQLVAGSWAKIGTATITSNGYCSFKWVPARVSTYVFRMYKPADTTLGANATPSFAVVTHT